MQAPSASTSVPSCKGTAPAASACTLHSRVNNRHRQYHPSSRPSTGYSACCCQHQQCKIRTQHPAEGRTNTDSADHPSQPGWHAHHCCVSVADARADSFCLQSRQFVDWSTHDHKVRSANCIQANQYKAHLEYCTGCACWRPG